MRLLPLIFLGIAGAAILTLLFHSRWVALFPVLGFCTLALGILFLNTEVALSFLLPVSWAFFYVPLLHILFVTQFEVNYFSDLLGALSGFLVAILAIPFIGVEALFIVCFLIALAIYCDMVRVRPVRLAGLVILLGLGAATVSSGVFSSFLNIHNLVYTFPEKSSPESRYAVLGNNSGNDLEVLAYQWSPIARVDVARNHTEDYVALFYDRMRWATFTNRPDGAQFYALLPTTTPRTSALIIGVGAGRDLLSLEALGYKHITGVEVNNATAALLRKTFSSETGDVYNRFPIVVGDGRAYVEAHSDTFDLISLPRADMSSSPSRDYVTPDAYLYTVEALHTYWERLSPEGVLWISRGALFDDLEDISPAHGKTVGTIRTFLDNQGLSAENHVLFF